MVQFMRGQRQDERLSRWVEPLHPYPSQATGAGRRPCLRSIDEVSAAVSSAEPDGKGVPVLLRQYLKFNATLLEFNVDPDFANSLDALVLVDLRLAPEAMLSRYMGTAGYRAFLADKAMMVA
jgi:hypothetical protein